MLDYKPFEQWHDEGGLDSHQIAHERVQRLLRDYAAPEIDPGTDEALQAYVAERKASEPDAYA